MKLLLLLIVMVFILEGLPYVAFPDAMRGWLARPRVAVYAGLLALTLAAMAWGLAARAPLGSPVCWC